MPIVECLDWVTTLRTGPVPKHKHNPLPTCKFGWVNTPYNAVVNSDNVCRTDCIILVNLYFSFWGNIPTAVEDFLKLCFYIKIPCSVSWQKNFEYAGKKKSWFILNVRILGEWQ